MRLQSILHGVTDRAQYSTPTTTSPLNVTRELQRHDSKKDYTVLSCGSVLIETYQGLQIRVPKGIVSLYRELKEHQTVVLRVLTSVILSSGVGG